MDSIATRKLLEQVRDGQASVESAIEKLRRLPFEDLGFAKVDHHRSIRCGFPEVVYCEGKTTEQVVAIIERRLAGGGNVLATRASAEVGKQVRKRFPASQYNPLGRTIVLRQQAAQPSPGYVAIICAGTADLPVAEEARETCEIMDQTTRSIYDVGVAGLHRLLAHSEALQGASAIVVCAGMEGALASVVGGLANCPVIGVPTSIGYGASFGGIAPLLTMLNSCAAGVAVVNIDNGFGGGYMAAMVARARNQKPSDSPQHAPAPAPPAGRTRRRPKKRR